MSQRRNFTFLLSILFLLNLILFINVNLAAQDYIPRDVNIDRSIIPKNILLGSYVGGRSHLKPLLDIAAVLAERDYNVTLLTSGYYTPSSEYPNIKQITLGPPPTLSDIVDSEKSFDFSDGVTAMNKAILNSYNHTFEKYKKAVEDYNIDLLICYAVVNDACLDVAHTLKKPVVGFSNSLSAIETSTYKSDPLFYCNISLENESFLERFRCTIIQPFKSLFLIYPFANRLNDIRKGFNVDPVFMSIQRLSKTSLVLVDGFFGFELPQALPPNVLEIGPVLSKEYPPLTPELNDFMNHHERVLYVSFGTRYYTSTENNGKILKSLVEVVYNKKLFDGVIWSLVQVSKDKFPSTITLNNGTKIQTWPILNNEDPHIHIAKFTPQFAVLNHKNTKLFFSHAGLGSAHESLYTNTPMLSLPIVGDQMGNAEKLRLSGVSLTLDKLNLNVDDILNKMELLLKDENVKKNSKRMEVLAKISSKRKYLAADLIEYILHNSGNNFNDGINEEFLKELIPANVRMGIIRGNNFDVYETLFVIILGIIGIILFILFKSVKRIFLSPVSSKSKTE